MEGMSEEQVVPVSSAWEEHTYLSEQRCSCGGNYRWVKWELHPENGRWLEVAYVECISCGAETEFWFDITRAFEGYGRGKNDIGKAWPPPYDGPYAVNEKEYRKRVEAIISELEGGKISQEDADHRLKEGVDDCHSKIAGKYQVFGYRRGSMGITYLCVDKDWSPNSSRPYFVICKTLDLSPDDTSIGALQREARLWLELGTHANLVKLYDVVAVSASRLVLVMEPILPGPWASQPLGSG
jgi:hypothetical protein